MTWLVLNPTAYGERTRAQNGVIKNLTSQTENYTVFEGSTNMHGPLFCDRDFENDLETRR